MRLNIGSGEVHTKKKNVYLCEMKTYRYTTTISDKGIIQIPPKAGLYNMEVEIVITPKTLKAKSEMKAEEFVKKWAGFLDTIDTDRSKLEYLTEKYK